VSFDLEDPRAAQAGLDVPPAAGRAVRGVEELDPRAPVSSSSHRVRRPAGPRRPPPPASTPWPFDAPDLWDTLTLAGVGFLGTAEVSGDPIGVDLDVAKPSGRDGGTIRDKGVKLAKVRFTLSMWDAETWASWDAILPVIDPRRIVGRRTPVDVSHPALAQRSIGRVYVESIGLPKVKDGSVEIVVNAVEFRPPSPRTTSRTARRPAVNIGGNAVAFENLITDDNTVATSPPSSTSTDP